MGDSQDFRTPDPEQQRRTTNAPEALISKEEQQELAHERGRICKKRSCAICAPLREQRRLKKKQRTIETQAQLHAKGQPCSRSTCTLAACVEARDVTTKLPADLAAGGREIDASQVDPERAARRQSERHRVGLPCGSEDCPNVVCVDGFANERTRRHRARRPCRSATCNNPICSSDRSTR